MLYLNTFFFQSVPLYTMVMAYDNDYGAVFVKTAVNRGIEFTSWLISYFKKLKLQISIILYITLHTVHINCTLYTCTTHTVYGYIDESILYAIQTYT